MGLSTEVVESMKMVDDCAKSLSEAISDVLNCGPDQEHSSGRGTNRDQLEVSLVMIENTIRGLRSQLRKFDGEG